MLAKANDEKRVVTIIVASIVGLVVLVFVAAVAFATIGAFRVATDARNPQKNAATAAQIADFRVPPGYRLLTALDLAFVKMAIVAPNGKSVPDFMMQLEGTSLPSGSESDEDMVRSMQQGMGFSGKCTTLSPIGEDRIKTASGKTLVMSVMRCSDKGTSRIVEVGKIPARLPLGIFIAEGSASAFDHAAVHSLLQSLR